MNQWVLHHLGLKAPRGYQSWNGQFGRASHRGGNSRGLKVVRGDG